MPFKTLTENLVYQKYMVSEHGLSLFPEMDNTKFLIDTGQLGNYN